MAATVGLVSSGFFLFPWVCRVMAATVASSSTSSPGIVDEIEGYVRLYSDGSIWRNSDHGPPIPVQDDGSVLWKDAVISGPAIPLRIYKPATADSGKLPILLYFHGGGLCIGSCTWPYFHNFSLRVASTLHAVVVAADYRLAPENRLPSCVEDGYTTVKWLQAQAVADGDPWLSEIGDFRRVFVSGDSAGGNIAHNLAVQIGAGSTGLNPARVRGYVLLYPFFGGMVRTKSEIEAPDHDAVLTLETTDKCWRLALPIGESRDYPLVNPFGPKSPNLEHLALDPILVLVGSKDILKDRIEDYAQRLKRWGKQVEYVKFEEAPHGFLTDDPNSDVTKQAMVIIKRFMDHN